MIGNLGNEDAIMLGLCRWQKMKQNWQDGQASARCPPASERRLVHRAGGQGGFQGSAPAPDAVLPSRGSAALAENAARTKIFQAFLTMSRATAERGARSATPGGGCAPRARWGN
jgi:hypothetical protein